jgi:hypothetical protein
MKDVRLMDYAESLAAVLRMWSTRELSRAEAIDVLEAAGLSNGDSTAILACGVARGILTDHEGQIGTVGAAA